MSLEINLKNWKKKRLFDYFAYDFVKVTGALPMLAWMRPKLYYPFGKPKKTGAMIVAANHPTWLDPIIVQVAFPFRHMHSLATKDLFDTKIKRLMFEHMHCIIVDKENFSLASFRAVVECLEVGNLVVIFPEGGIDSEGTGDVRAYKSGAVLMAHKAGASIVPMYIIKRKKWYHRQRAVVGMPVDVAQLLGKMPTMQAVTEITELLREKEIELKEYFESLPVYTKLFSESKKG